MIGILLHGNYEGLFTAVLIFGFIALLIFILVIFIIAKIVKYFTKRRNNSKQN